METFNKCTTVELDKETRLSLDFNKRLSGRPVIFNVRDTVQCDHPRLYSFILRKRHVHTHKYPQFFIDIRIKQRITQII